MKKTAVAPANIAFIKYWGKVSEAENLPANPSISMNLSACTTTTTVEFSPRFTRDEVSVGFDRERIVSHIDRIRRLAKTSLRVRVETKNSFPTGSGVASSASGFAALTVATASALGLHMDTHELSKLARLGSGSACRSIPDGFVKWVGDAAMSLYPPDYWDLRDVIVIVDKTTKSISSSQGHKLAETSPFFTRRLAAISGRMKRLEEALKTKNIKQLGEVIEEDCLDMHHVMQTQTPPLWYWTGDTQRVIDLVKKSHLPAYFTVDAGSNVHFICEAKTLDALRTILLGFEIIVNAPSIGAHTL